MQISRRHHFVPEFYLKAWLGNDDKGLWLYKRDFNEQIRSDRRPTKSVGFVKDLYTLHPELRGVEDWGPRPDAIETNFFTKLDTEAALVHQKLLISGTRDLSEQEKYTWAKFMNSLMERGPSRINEIEAADSVQNIHESLVQRFGSQELMGQALSRINLEGLYRNAVRGALISYICDDNFLKHVVEKMRWTIVYNPIEGEHFVTSDVPLLVNAGSEPRPIDCMSLPLSPRHLLVVHSKSDDFDEGFLRTLTVVHNIQLIKRAEQYVVSSRKLDDGPHTKYSRVIQEFFRKSSGRPDAEDGML